MTEAESKHREKIFRELFLAVLRHGVKQGITATIDPETGRAFTATWQERSVFCVAILPHEPTFIVNFDGGPPQIAFNVSGRDASRLPVAAPKCFPAVDEAAEWFMEVVAAIGGKTASARKEKSDG